MIARESAVPNLSPKVEEARVPGVESVSSRTVDSSPITNLMPQSLGGVFDEAFDLYKRHFALLALIVAMIFIPTQILMYAMENLWLKPLSGQAGASDSNYFAVLLTIALGFLIGSPQAGIPGFLPLMLSFMASGPLSKAVGNIVTGKPASVKEAYRGSFLTMFKLAWAWGLFALIILACGVISWIVIFVVFSFIAVALSASGMSVIVEALSVVVAILLFVVPYLLATALGAALFAFFAPSVAIEKYSLSGAMGRTMQLVRKGLFLRVWAAVSLLPVVIYGLQILILLSVQSFVGALHLPAFSEFLLLTGFANGVCFFLTPFWMIFITLLYYDFRIRREGLDIRAIFEKDSSLQKGASE